MSNSLRKALFYRIDGIILLLYVVLVFIGISAVFSVEHRTTEHKEEHRDDDNDRTKGSPHIG